MKITEPKDVKIGQWYSWCCILDLYEITNQQTLKDQQEMLQDMIDEGDTAFQIRVWDTLESALNELNLEEDGKCLEIRPDLKDKLYQQKGYNHGISKSN